MDKYQLDTVWANDPHFDFIILRNWWERYRKPGSPDQPIIACKWPFAYNAPRSYRTIVEIGEQVGFTSEMRGATRGMYVAHSAVEDAAAQARVVIAVKKFILNSVHRPFIHKPAGSWQAVKETA